MVVGVSVILDKGPWHAFCDEDIVYIESDDFTYDVWLEVTGDFEDISGKLAYAHWLAEKLNGHKD